ncbi:MAG TPA: FtsH protease activity modulator HflK, partial [Rhodopila sp.]|uniref:FtsH protease activity modulator HflK n=1 Tax=Rhodopila sp. TaxID=2480087 RepID=UPI002C6FBC50
NSGGSGPWGEPPKGSGEPGRSDKNGRKKPESEPIQGPWGHAGGDREAGPNDDKRDERREDKASRGGPRRPGGGPFGQNPFGGGPFGGGPFGGGPFGGGNEFDRLIAQAQAFIRGLLGGGGKGGGPGASRFGGGRGLFLAVLAILVIWMASGFYRVQPDEQGIVLRFGAYAYWTPPGLHWHLPWPVESVETPAVTRINRTEIGYRSAGSDTVQSGRDATGRDVLAESLMLTGDENIIDIDVAVFWRISNASDFLFNTADPAMLVRAVAESSLREVIGRTPIQPALTQLRAQIETDVLKQTQQILDRYKAGVEITQVQLQKVDPPAAVIESFRDVQRANTDAERMRNEAEAYRNDIVPRARGDAARIIAEGQGVKAATVAKATGEAQRFDSVYKAYEQAKDVTIRRLYLDTMEDILRHAHPLVVDDKLKGLVPFLPLSPPAGQKPAQLPPPSPPASPGDGTSPQGGNSQGGNSQGGNAQGGYPQGGNSQGGNP